MSTVSQSIPIQVGTSKLGQLDYMWGQDGVLVNSDVENTSFADNNGYVPSTLPTTNLWSQWSAASGVSHLSWSVKQSPAGVIAFAGGNAGNITTAVDNTINNNVAITNPNTLLHSYNTEAMTAISILYAVVKPLSFTAGNCWFGFSTVADNFGNSYCRITTVDSTGNIAIDGNNIGQMTVGNWYILCAIMDFTNAVVGGYIIPITNPIVEPVFSLVASANTAQPSVITVGANALSVTTEDFSLAEIDVFDTSVLTPLRQSILNYIANTYGPYPFTLPLTFPSTSVPQSN